jgi:hypothetical protein
MMPGALTSMRRRFHHAADDRVADGYVRDPARALDQITLFDARRIAEDGDADVVLLEVQNQTEDLTRELHELTGHHALESVNAGDAVTARQHRARLTDQRSAVEVLDLLLDDRGNFVGTELHGHP